MLQALWWAWAIVCAAGVRILVVRALSARFGGGAYAVAYATWVGLFGVGLVAADALGFQMYGFDASDPKQRLSGWILFYSPFGFPILAGAPFVILGDLVRLLTRPLSSPRTR